MSPSAGKRIAWPCPIADQVSVSVTVVEWLNPPLVPVMVNVVPPFGLCVLVDTVNVDVPVAGLGLKVPVAPLGNPEMVSATLPVNPFFAAIVMVYVVFAPRATLLLLGWALMLKSGEAAAVTTSVALVVWLSAPLVPVIVSG